jgi:hypothetical protein
MRIASRLFLGLTLAAGVFCACLFLQRASESRREWEARNLNLMVRAELMQVAHPYAVDETTTALRHGDRGSIAGTVIYENRKPVQGATVYAEPIGGPPGSYVYPYSETDRAGRFEIEISPSWFGVLLAVSAKKEIEDYPPMNQFYGLKFQPITLTVHHRGAITTIQLGPKGGVLMGTVTDAVTGYGLNPCVEFGRANVPSSFLAGTGLVNATYRFLIPSNTDVLMKVWCGRHKPWYYPGTTDETERRSLNLKPGEELNLDIRLVPDEARQEECGMPVGTVIRP